jgi:hypothetical protein
LHKTHLLNLQSSKLYHYQLRFVKKSRGAKDFKATHAGSDLRAE